MLGIGLFFVISKRQHTVAESRVGRRTTSAIRWNRKKMLAFLHRILDWFKNVFWKEEMELALVGLQNSGKTTFVNVIAVSLVRSPRLSLPPP